MFNGGLIGAAPSVSLNSAVGAWDIEEVYDYVKDSSWPQRWYQNVALTGITSDVTVYNNNTKNVNIFKASGSAGWVSQAYGSTGYTAPCTIEYNKDAGSSDNGLSYAMIGWNVDPSSDASYSSIDYAAYPYATGAYYIYNNGTQIIPGVSWSNALKLYIVYDTDGYIRHYNGPNLLYSANYGTGKTVYLDTSLYSVSPVFGGFSNVRIATASWDGTKYL